MIIFLWKFTIFKLLSRGYSIYLNWPPFINAYFNKPCYDSKTIIFINFGKTKSKIGKKGKKAIPNLKKKKREEIILNLKKKREEIMLNHEKRKRILNCISNFNNIAFLLVLFFIIALLMRIFRLNNRFF